MSVLLFRYTFVLRKAYPERKFNLKTFSNIAFPGNIPKISFPKGKDARWIEFRLLEATAGSSVPPVMVQLLTQPNDETRKAVSLINFGVIGCNAKVDFELSQDNRTFEIQLYEPSDVHKCQMFMDLMELLGFTPET